MTDREGSKNHQRIEGDNNQVAGRDINHYGGGGFQPDPHNPNLTTCPSCGYFGISSAAVECRECGCSFALLGAIEEEKARELTQMWLLSHLLCIAVAFFVLDHLNYAYRWGLGPLGFIALMALADVAVMVGLPRLWAWSRLALARAFKRR